MRLIDADVASRWMEQNEAYIDAEILRAIPTVDAVPVVHGRWEGRFPYCSICGQEAISRDNGTLHGSYFLTDYCPNCRAKMDGGVNNATN